MRNERYHRVNTNKKVDASRTLSHRRYQSLRTILGDVFGHFSVFLLLFGVLWDFGVPTLKRWPNRVKILIDDVPKMVPFWSKSEHRDPSPKTLNFRPPSKQPQSGILVANGPEGCPKEGILEVFLVHIPGLVGIARFDVTLTRYSFF